MLNLRHLALAAALILVLAAGAYADPMSETYEATADVVARVSNLRLFEPAYVWERDSRDLEPEQLVEGHSTFVTMDVTATRKAVEGFVNVTGMVECEHSGNVTTTPYGVWVPPFGYVDVPFLTGVKDVYLRCHVEERVVATPTIYCQVSGDWDCEAPSAMAPLMVPTGRVFPFLAPDGQAGTVEELAFSATPEGESEPRTFYAYSFPILRPWQDLDDGAFRNFWAPVPYDALYEMDSWDFKFLHEDGVNRI